MRRLGAKLLQSLDLIPTRPSSIILNTNHQLNVGTNVLTLLLYDLVFDLINTDVGNILDVDPKNS